MIVSRLPDYRYNDTSIEYVPDTNRGGANAAGKYSGGGGATDQSGQFVRPVVEGSNYAPNYGSTRLPYTAGVRFSGDPENIGNYESKSTNVAQQATDVYRGYIDRIGGALSGLTYNASQMRDRPIALRTSLGLIGTGTGPNDPRFQGADALRNALSGGIDYYGRLGLSEGIQNLRAQENAANNALQARLGRTAGSSALIAALQNQNRMRTQMAINPLLSEAQKGSYERGLTNVGLENQRLQLANAVTGQEGNFYNQSVLSQLQGRLAGMQPTQSLLEALIALQGQGRGVASTENALGGKNYT